MNARTMIAIGLTLTAMVLVVGSSPTQIQAAGNTFHFRQAGQGASGFWSTCPDQVCTYTYINVSETMFRENGTRFSGTTLCLDQYIYASDTGDFISSSFGCGDATLSIDKKLTSASTSAHIPIIVTCTQVGDVTNCAEGGPADVSGSWTGVGDLERSKSNFHFNSNNFTVNSHSRGIFRNATGSAQVNGIDLGTSIFADMFNLKSGDVSVCHGSC